MVLSVTVVFVHDRYAIGWQIIDRYQCTLIKYNYLLLLLIYLIILIIFDILPYK